MSSELLKFASSGCSVDGPRQLSITVQSAGFNDGNFVKIDVRRDGNLLKLSDNYSRGINAVALDPLDGSILDCRNFDTHASSEASEEFALFVESLEPQTLVVLAIQDEGSENLSDVAITSCELLGAEKIRQIKYRDSWCLIGEKGFPSSTIDERLSPSGSGPTLLLQKTVDLVAKRRSFLGFTSPEPSPPGSPTGYGYGNNLGILIGKEVLPSQPTISEKTPGEFNFALQVESHLDVIRDPAERQIAIECLLVIAVMAERNPEMQLNYSVLNLVHLLDDAVSLFWAYWINRSAAGPSDSGGVANNEGRASISRPPTQLGPVIRKSASSSSFREAGRSSKVGVAPLSPRLGRTARRLFYDLPSKGPQGTMTFLAKSCNRLCFDVTWTGE
ncbi:Cell surface hyaluronidase [Cladochytrium tenue]|nr:Cell surface hyaluronidase [Cladochytrium tenue]